MFSTHRKRIRWITFALTVVLGVTLVSGLSQSNVSNAQGPEEDEDEGIFFYAPLSEDEMSEHQNNTPEADFGSLAIAWCNYDTMGDNPHLSSTGFAVSAHGWWIDNSPGSCPEYADVEVTLQAWSCYGDPNGSHHCLWETLDHKEKRIRAGGGSGRRTTARHDCVSYQQVSYRSIIDVDLVGIWDGPYKAYRYNNVACYPGP